MAGALVGNPEVIILDEPTVGLDPIQMIEMRDTIRSLAKGHTVLLSSHILSEVSAICDHIIIISHGKIVASNTPDGLADMMEGSNTLKLTVKDPTRQLEQVLSHLPHVDYYSVQKSDDSKLVSAEIEYNKNTEIRDDLFFALSDAELPVYSMEVTSRSLEDIFIELTESEKELEENARKTEIAGKNHFWKHNKPEQEE